MKVVVGLGEVLLRISPQTPLRLLQSVPGSLYCCVAGAEANTLASIAQLGGGSRIVTAVPANPVADGCLAFLRGLGVDVSAVHRAETGRLGLMFLEPGVGQRASQVFYDREQSVFSLSGPEAYDWDAVFADADWLHVTGISGALSSEAERTVRFALEEAVRRACTISFDPNFRSKLWRWQPGVEPLELASRVLAGWMPMINVFFGGLSDIALVSGIHPHPSADNPWLDAVRQLSSRYPRLQQVVGTCRAGISASEDLWSAVLWDVASGAFVEAPRRGESVEPYQIAPVVDRIGAGDAFAAGLIFATRTPALNQPQTRLEFATAAGCLSHWVHGDINFSTRGEVEALVAGVRGGRVNR
jgi:2-dehydro-3-deoxygluconokinase